MNENSLSTERIGKLFWQYSIPTTAAMLFLGLNTIVDGLFVGHYIGADALACVNIAMPFSSFLFAFSVVIGIGAQSIISRKLGEGNILAANTAFQTAMSIAGGMSLLFTAVALIFPTQIAIILGANEHLMSQVAEYIRYLGLFLPFMALVMVLDYALKTVAMPVYAMIALVIAVCSHMFLNWLLIAKLAMGIKGAALAMGIAFMISFVMALIPFLTNKVVLRLFKGSFDRSVARPIVYNGLSEGLSEIGTGITTFLFNITLMRYVGETGVAAFTVISYLAFIGTNILIGASDGAGVIISYNYGSRQMERVKKTLRLAIVTGLVIGMGIFIAIFAFSYEVISLFLNEGNEEVLSFAVNGAKLYSFAFLINGLNIAAAGYFTAIGNPKNAVLIALSKGMVWIAICITVLPVWIGVQGIWMTVPIAESVTVLFSGFLLYRHFKDQTHICS